MKRATGQSRVNCAINNTTLTAVHAIDQAVRVASQHSVTMHQLGRSGHRRHGTFHDVIPPFRAVKSHRPPIVLRVATVEAKRASVRVVHRRDPMRRGPICNDRNPRSVSLRVNESEVIRIWRPIGSVNRSKWPPIGSSRQLSDASIHPRSRRRQPHRQRHGAIRAIRWQC